jgi:hypothetical protein
LNRAAPSGSGPARSLSRKVSSRRIPETCRGDVMQCVPHVLVTAAARLPPGEPCVLLVFCLHPNLKDTSLPLCCQFHPLFEPHCRLTRFGGSTVAHEYLEFGAITSQIRAHCLPPQRQQSQPCPTRLRNPSPLTTTFLPLVRTKFRAQDNLFILCRRCRRPRRAGI